jgi:hypothetical protein
VLRHLDSKILKLKLGDTHSRVRDNLTALVWKDEQDVHILTNMHRLPTESNFCVKGNVKNLSLLQTTFGTCATLKKGTEWLIAIQLFRDDQFFFWKRQRIIVKNCCIQITSVFPFMLFLQE